MKPIKPYSMADIINGRQCMEILHIASKTLFKCMRERGDIPFHTRNNGNKGHRIFYYRSEIEALLRPAHLNLPSNPNTCYESANIDTMSSLQIAEVTGKQHAHIMRDIRALLEQGVSESNFGLSSYLQPQPNGGYKTVSCYTLTKKGCLILASGYNAKLREKIIDRLEELEIETRTESFRIPLSKTMSSLQIAEVTGKRHCDVLEAIHNMEPAWEKVNGRKFALVEFKDAKGEMRPMYQLNKTECLYIATKFNDEARAKLVIRWEELERIHTTGGFRVPQTYAEALRQLADTVEARSTTQNMPLQRPNKILNPIKTIGSTAIPTAYPCKVSTLARILQEYGIVIGRNQLFAWLRENGYLYTQGEDYNLPTPKAEQMKLFEVKHTIIDKPDGNLVIASILRVTAAGQLHFMQQILGDKVS